MYHMALSPWPQWTSGLCYIEQHLSSKSLELELRDSNSVWALQLKWKRIYDLEGYAVAIFRQMARETEKASLEREKKKKQVM